MVWKAQERLIMSTGKNQPAVKAKMLLLLLLLVLVVMVVVVLVLVVMACSHSLRKVLKAELCGNWVNTALMIKCEWGGGAIIDAAAE